MLLMSWLVYARYATRGAQEPWKKTRVSLEKWLGTLKWDGCVTISTLAQGFGNLATNPRVQIKYNPRKGCTALWKGRVGHSMRASAWLCSLAVTTRMRSVLRATSPISNEKCFLQAQGNKREVRLKTILSLFLWIPLSLLDMRCSKSDQTGAT